MITWDYNTWHLYDVTRDCNRQKIRGEDLEHNVLVSTLRTLHRKSCANGIS